MTLLAKILLSFCASVCCSCSGWYTGTATNNYGSVSFSVNCVVNGDGGSHTIKYIEYGAFAAAGFILAVLLICFVFGVRRWMKPKRPHQETGLEQSSESASLLQSGTDGQYHYDGDGSDGHGSLARQGIPTAAAGKTMECVEPSAKFLYFPVHMHE